MTEDEIMEREETLRQQIADAEEDVAAASDALHDAEARLAELRQQYVDLGV